MKALPFTWRGRSEISSPQQGDVEPCACCCGFPGLMPWYQCQTPGPAPWQLHGLHCELDFLQTPARAVEKQNKKEFFILLKIKLFESKTGDRIVDFSVNVNSVKIRKKKKPYLCTAWTWQRLIKKILCSAQGENNAEEKHHLSWL